MLESSSQTATQLPYHLATVTGKHRAAETLQLRPSNQKLDILEVGPAFGYTTIDLLTIYPQAQVTAIEISEDYAKLAKKHLSRYGDRVRIFNGDGYFLDDELKRLIGEHTGFDRVFMMNNFYWAAAEMTPQQIGMVATNTFQVLRESGLWTISNESNYLTLQRRGRKLRLKEKKFSNNETLRRLFRTSVRQTY